MKIYRNLDGHKKGDTFRELLGMWEESGYCELVDSDDRFCWVGGVGDILLYEYARFDFLPEKWNHGLFSNMQPLDCGSCVPWIFWSRHPRKLEAEIERGILSYNERETVSIFLGKIENNIQLNARTEMGDWSTCIEEFNMPVVMGNVNYYPYTQEEYLVK